MESLLTLDCRYNRVLVITNYANSATRDYMTAREIHVLVVTPDSAMGELPAVLNLAKAHRLSIARVRTAGNHVPDYLDRGDIVMELVGIAGQHGEDFGADVAKISTQISVSEVPVEEITVRSCPSLPLCCLTTPVLSHSLSATVIGRRHTWTNAQCAHRMRIPRYASLNLMWSSLVMLGIALGRY